MSAREMRMFDAMAKFDNMYRESVYVRCEGSWLIVEFDGCMLHVDLESGKTVVESDDGETIYEVGGGY